MSVVDGSTVAASILQCQVCGRGPTAIISVSRNVGMLVLRQTSSYRAPLCRDHGSQLARNWLLATFLMGWWGLTSFFINFGAVMLDLRALRAARRLQPAGSVIAARGFGMTGLTSPAPLPQVSTARLGLVAAGILLVAIVAVLNATFGSKSVGELAVGDCFDTPSTSGSVSDVPHRPCSLAHAAEVFAIVTYAGAQSGTYPTEAEFQASATTQCGPAFVEYTGGGGGLAATADVGYMTPTEDGWSTGDRTMICYLMAPTGQTLTQSLRAATH